LAEGESENSGIDEGIGGGINDFDGEIEPGNTAGDGAKDN